MHTDDYHSTDGTSIATDNKPQIAQAQSSSASCPSCGFERASIVRMAKGHPHYAALKCGRCDRFLDWMPAPATEGKRRDTSVKVDRLLKLPNLTRWEQEFLQGLKGKKLSPKQQECLAKIEAKAGA